MKTMAGWKKTGLGLLAIFGIALAGGIGHDVYEATAHAHDLTHPDYIYGPALGTPTGTDANVQAVMFYQIALALIQGDYHGLGIQTQIPPLPQSAVDIFELKNVGLCLEFPDGGVSTLAGVPVTVYSDAGFVAPTNNSAAYFPSSLGVDGGFTSLNGTIANGGLTVTGGETTDTLVATARLSTDGGFYATEGATITGGETVDTVTASGLVKTYTYPVAADPQQTAAVLIQSGQAAIGTSTGYTFTTATPAGVAFSATPICVCTDVTSAAAIKCVASTTACTPTGTSTDTFNWVAIGLK
jgi:hypothetical protein